MLAPLGDYEQNSFSLLSESLHCVRCLIFLTAPLPDDGNSLPKSTTVQLIKCGNVTRKLGDPVNMCVVYTDIIDCCPAILSTTLDCQENVYLVSTNVNFVQCLFRYTLHRVNNVHVKCDFYLWWCYESKLFDMNFACKCCVTNYENHVY